ncbi:MAG: phosphoribosylformylglycinamidine synthase subunit PurS [Phycisphaerales bacterium]|nr:phosphoribosylformylglycinamidine synthase subunit PurS [Phycisphaerales bacterium]
MTTADAVVTRVHRIEVRPRPSAGDPRAQSLLHDASTIGIALSSVRTARVYLIEAALDQDQLEVVRTRLLEDPVIESSAVGASAPAPGETTLEVHPLPGVMDPAAQAVARAIADLTGATAEVVTAWRYDLGGIDQAQAQALARRLLANPVVHAIHNHAHLPGQLPKGRPAEFRVTPVPIRDLDDAALERLSRDAHLFLSLDEMRAIREEYRRLDREPTDIELETLAQTWSEHCVHKTLKSTIRYRNEGVSSGSRVRAPRASDGDPICWQGRPGHEVHPDGSVTIHNLLKSTVAAATHELIAEGVDWTLSVFVDNAGVIVFDDDHAVCVKVETHNHPSALEPYGGAATGIGGCIRDIMGTGLAARPIANTDVFCVAHPDHFAATHTEGREERKKTAELSSGSLVSSVPSKIQELPSGCLHPRRILTDVVAGVRDYGNRMGIPTVNGAVWFDDRYVGNPLVFCGCIGIMPRDRVEGRARPGDLIVALGGRTGRDGIHGATFSSAELTDTHADEFSHAVQIGNAIEEKRVLDAILRARDFGGFDRERSAGEGAGPLYSAITDCGAGGFSSAVGEMGEHLGAEVHLERAPLKYAGLTYTEIWISEAQERMVLAVPKEKLAALQQICDEEHVELCVLGTFGTPARDLVLRYNGHEVGRLPMEFLHNGIPTPAREAVWRFKDFTTENTETNNRKKSGSDSVPTSGSPVRSVVHSPSLRDALLALLAHPNIASKHFIIRQYDHEVQGNTIIRPLGGPSGRGPMDAAVIEPVPGTHRGLAIACGLATGLEADPYHMALAAIDECVRNLVCIGADPDRIAILDNFCWPSCKKPENLASLVRAAEGCYDGAKAYRTPFISGKDSLNNQFTTEDGRTIEIPPTLLITGVGIVDDVRKCVTMDAKSPGSELLLVSGVDRDRPRGLANSHYARMFGIVGQRTDSGGPVDSPALVDLRRGRSAAQAVASLITSGRVRAAHDISDGGLLVALAEMLIAGSTPERPIGANIALQRAGPDVSELFGETPSTFLLEIEPPRDDADRRAVIDHFRRVGVLADFIGDLTDTGMLEVQTSSSGRSVIPVSDLAAAWLGTLDW